MKNTNIDKLNYIIKMRKIEIENIEKIIKAGNGNKEILSNRIKILKDQILDNKNKINNFEK
jgi:hypothetical protein